MSIQASSDDVSIEMYPGDSVEIWDNSLPVDDNVANICDKLFQGNIPYVSVTVKSKTSFSNIDDVTKKKILHNDTRSLTDKVYCAIFDLVNIHLDMMELSKKMEEASESPIDNEDRFRKMLDNGEIFGDMPEEDRKKMTLCSYNRDTDRSNWVDRVNANRQATFDDYKNVAIGVGIAVGVVENAPIGIVGGTVAAVEIGERMGQSTERIAHDIQLGLTESRADAVRDGYSQYSGYGFQ